MNRPLTRRNFLGLAGATAGGLALGRGRSVAADSAGVQSRAAEADRLIARQVRSGEVTAAAFLMREGAFEFARAYGHAKIDTPFLIASPTKPMTASAVMWLRERRQLALTDPVGKYLPQFKGDGREAVTIRHLLTHTSGLPDMLPENVELRRRHAPLGEFVAQTCRTKLLFRPGEKVSYQSMGILLAAEIVERITRQPLRQFLKAELFQPLKMNGTALGQLADAIKIQVEHADPPGGTPETANWDWNSNWWRDFGAPWGGAHSTAADIAKLLHAFLHPTGMTLKKETARRMTSNQNTALDKPYGIGWAMTPNGFGHGGSTGTSCWADTAKDATFVLLTSLPAKVSQKPIIDPVSKAVRAAL